MKSWGSHSVFLADLAAITWFHTIIECHMYVGRIMYSEILFLECNMKEEWSSMESSSYEN